MAAEWEYAALAAHAYSDTMVDAENSYFSPDNFVQREVKVGGPSGFFARAYDNGSEIVMAIRGSEFRLDAINDWVNNVRLALGLDRISVDPNNSDSSLSQLDLALSMALELKQQAAAEGKSLVVVGHSLGGGLAGLVSSILQIEGYGFDVAPFGNMLDRDLYTKNALSSLVDRLPGGELAQLLATSVGEWILENREPLPFEIDYADRPSQFFNERFIKNEALQVLELIGIVLPIPPVRFDAKTKSIYALTADTFTGGAAEAVALHSMDLLALAIKTASTNNGGAGGDWTQRPLAGADGLMISDADLRDILFPPDPLGMIADKDGILDPTPLYRTWAEDVELYKAHYDVLNSDGLLQNGRAAEGLSAETPDESSLHAVLLKLGLSVVRDGIKNSNITEEARESWRLNDREDLVQIDLDDINVATAPPELVLQNGRAVGTEFLDLWIWDEVAKGISPGLDRRVDDVVGDIFGEITKDGVENGTETAGDVVVITVQAGEDDAGLEYTAEGDAADKNNLIVGGDGPNTLEGGTKDDILIGGDDDDILVFTAGDDILVGGDGTDEFVVTDETSGENVAIGGLGPRDKLVFDDEFTQTTLNLDAGAIEDNVFNGIELDIGGDTTFTLYGINEITLSESITNIESTDGLEDLLQINYRETAVEIERVADTDEVASSDDEVRLIIHNFDVAERQETERFKLGTATDFDDGNRSNDIIIIDGGKQLFGGVGFDFDKYDRLYSTINRYETNYFLGQKDYDGIMAEENFLDAKVEVFLDALELTAKLAQLGTAIGAVTRSPLPPTLGLALFGTSIGVMELWKMNFSYRDIQDRRYFGVHGEEYILGRLNDDGTRTLTIRIDPDDTLTSQRIVIENWKDGDYGISIVQQEWGQGYDRADPTSHDGIITSDSDLTDEHFSDEWIRQKVANEGLIPDDLPELPAAAARSAAYSSAPGAAGDGPTAFSGPTNATAAATAAAETLPGLVRNGNDSANKLRGTDGNDVFNGGRGSDLLVGGEGRDIYLFGAGDGADIIIDPSGEGSLIRFESSVDFDAVTYEEIAGDDGATDYLITYGDGDTITVKNWSDLTPEAQQLWSYEALAPRPEQPTSYDQVPNRSTPTPVLEGTSADDQLLGLDDAEVLRGYAGNDSIAGGGGADFIYAGSGNDVTFGGSGRDQIQGEAGNDELAGGTGADRLDGGDGSDRYLFNLGDGQDTIIEYARDGGVDTLVFGFGIDPANILISRSADNTSLMTLSIEGTDDQVILPTQYYDEDGRGSKGIERVEFADGTVWDRVFLQELYIRQNVTDGDDTFLGTINDERFEGGSGDDLIIGGDGSDDYVWSRGDGNDTIREFGDEYGPAGNRLIFGEGISSSDITLERTAEDPYPGAYETSTLLITIAGPDGGSVRLTNYFEEGGLQKIVFADGEVWTKTEVFDRWLATQPTDGNDIVFGTKNNDVIDLGAGDDVMSGDDGDDILIGGAGNDQLGSNFDRGDDTYIGGAGNDQLAGGSGDDTYIFEANFGNDRLRDYQFRNSFETSNYVIFRDNTLDDFAFRATGVLGNDLLIDEVNGNNSLYIEGFFQDPNDRDGAIDLNNYWQSIRTFEFADGEIVAAERIAEIALVAGEVASGETGTDAADTLEGTAERDRLAGEAGDDEINGAAGGDYLLGGAGADTISGGDGDDLIIGGTGSDVIFGGADDDKVFAGLGDDSVTAGAGDDYVTGSRGIDTIDGGDGDDLLSGGQGNDILTGGSGADELFGDDGDDQLTGGLGSDTLTGGAGSDTYLYNVGDGRDVIDASTDRLAGETETLILGPGLTRDLLRPSFDGRDLVLRFANGLDDQITITDFLGRGQINEIQFGDSTTMTGQELLEFITAATPEDDDSPAGFETTDLSYFGNPHYIVYGGRGDDYLSAFEQDTYFVFARGDGNDEIFGASGSILNDRWDLDLVLQDYRSDEVNLARGDNGLDLVITFTDTDDSVTLINHFKTVVLFRTLGVSSIIFADGVVWNRNKMALESGRAEGGGTSQADVFESSAADEVFAGGGGNDVYIVGQNGGADVIDDASTSSTADVLRFGPGIAPQSISVTRDGDNILLTLSDGQSVLLLNQLAGDNQGIERVEFESGDIWNRGTLISRLLSEAASESDDVLVGSDAGETLDGGAGDDMLAGGEGGDTYVYAAGDGNDVIDETATSGTDVLVFDASISNQGTTFRRDAANADDLVIVLEDGSEIRVVGQFAGGGVEQIEFADGSNMGRDTIEQRTAAQSQTDGDDLVVGTAEADFINGQEGNDRLDGGLGADIYIYEAGDGIDRIEDSGAGGEDGLALTQGVSADDVVLSRVGDDLVIDFANNPDDQITVVGHFGDHALSRLVFEDGTLWASDEISYRAETGMAPAGGGSDPLPAPLNDQLEMQAAPEDEAFNFVIPADVFADPAAVTVTLSNGQPLPSWLTFADGALSGTPVEGDSALLELTIAGTDTNGEAISKVLTIVATPGNDAPVAQGTLPTFEGERYEEVAFDLSSVVFTDEEDTELFYIVVSEDGSEMPDWLSFDPVTTMLTGEVPSSGFPDDAISRTLNLRLIAEDSGDKAAAVDFSIVLQQFPQRTIDGTDGADNLEGTNAWDTITGGLGDDVINANGGTNTFIYNEGDGADRILRYSSSNDEGSSFGGRLELGPGIDPADLILTRTTEGDSAALLSNKNTLVITFADPITGEAVDGQSITILEQFGSTRKRDRYDGGDAIYDLTVAEIVFDDGTIWDRAQIIEEARTADEYIGSGQSDVLTGTDADETLIGLAGNDTFDGGAGDDTMIGGLGNDTYIFGYGSGSDNIIDLVTEPSSTFYGAITVDTLKFGPGITLEDLTFELGTVSSSGFGRFRATLTIGLKDSPEDTVVLNNQYVFQVGRSFGIDRFVFDDGTVMTQRQMDAFLSGDGITTGTDGDDMLTGTTIDDRIIGGAGDDVLQGNLGNDTYVWNRGDGTDTIYESDDRTFDVLEFGAGITAADITLRRGEGVFASDNMFIDIAGTDDFIRIFDQFQVSREELDGGNLTTTPIIDEIRFQDGTAWSAKYINDYFTKGTAGDDTLLGFEWKGDVLDGGAGDDVLDGQGGDDIYIFGRGYGNDTINDAGPINAWERDINRVIFTEGIRPEDLRMSQDGTLKIFFDGSDDSLTINTRVPIEFEFQETGTVWTRADLVQLYVQQNTTDGDDTHFGLPGSVFDGGIDTGAGNDTLYFNQQETIFGGDGSDTYIVGPDNFNVSDAYIEDVGSITDIDRLQLLYESFDPADLDVEIAANGLDLLLDFYVTNRLVLANMAQALPGNGIEEVVFYDGTTYSAEWLRANAAPSEASQNVLTGTDGDDTLTATRSADSVLDGGLGDDILRGAEYKDNLFVWRPGDGNDQITDDSGYRNVDSLQLIGVNKSDVTMTRTSSTFVITYEATGETITFSGIEEVLFEDGRYRGETEINAAAVFAGTDGNDTIAGWSSNDTLFGGLGNDSLYGSSGTGVGFGNGDDTFVYRSGDGNDLIVDDSALQTETDTLKFLDLNLADIAFAYSGSVGSHLRVQILDTGQSILVRDQFAYGDSNFRGIERIEFADGTAIDGRTLIEELTQHRGDSGNNTVSGSYSTDDIIVGGQGNDVLRGGGGSDEYRFAVGDGNDIIDEDDRYSGEDRIAFAAGILPENVTLSRSADGADLIISYADQGDTITVLDHLANRDGEIAQIVFDGGEIWDRDEILKRLINASPADEEIVGSAGDDILAGLGGDDIMRGLGGADTYEYGLNDGNDIIRDGGTDGAEIDVLKLGAGILPDQVTVVQDGDNIVLQITATNETITLENRMVDVLASADAVLFDDGTYWDFQILLEKAAGASTNALPVAGDDTATATDVGVLTFAAADLLANDTDLDGDVLTIVSVGPATGGTVSLDGTTITFTPEPGFSGDPDFRYTISDGNGGFDGGRMVITYSDTSDQIDAVDDTVSVDEDNAVLIDVLANDTDSAGDALTLVSVTGAVNGTASVQDGQISYTPNPDFNGVETLTYVVSNGPRGTATATVSVTVTAQNDAPVAVDDAVSIDQGQSTLIDVLANDTDVDDDTLVLISATGAVGGTVSVEAGQLLYVPNTEFVGLETLTYEVSDGAGGLTSGTVTIEVNKTNEGPTAVLDTAVVDEDGSVLIDVAANDTDPDNDTLIVESVGTAANGSVSIEDNQLRYTPDANFSGTDTVTYTITDGRGETATGTVDITVNEVNDNPIAIADTAVVAEDADVLIDVIGNDVDFDGGTPTLLSVDGVTNGTAVIEAGLIRFTPDPDYNGPATINYTISDGQGGNASSSVQIDVLAVNDAPIAVDDIASVDSGGTILIDAIANDSDPDGDFIYISNVSWSGGGTVSFVNGQLQYEAVNNFSSNVVITYTLNDGDLQSTGTVRITVEEPNTAPSANDDTAAVVVDGSVLIDVLANDTDSDGDPLTILDVGAASNGTATVENNQLRYVPDAGFTGVETITYTIDDGEGGTATASVTISVNPVDAPNTPPVAVNDTAALDQDSSVLIDVLANDSDPDGDPLTILSVDTTANASAVIENGEIRYTPDAGFSGADTFTYTISDGEGGTATATVDVDVAAVQAGAPIVVDDYVTVAPGGIILIDALANDSDPDGDGIYISRVAPTIAAAINFVDGQIEYEALANYTGVVEMVYTVSDFGGTTSTGTVFITITDANADPVATNDIVSVASDTAIAVDLLANDSDTDNDSLTITMIEGQAMAEGDSMTLPSGASVTLMPNGMVQFDPSGAFEGLAVGETAVEPIAYTISDGNGGTSDAVLTVTVEGTMTPDTNNFGESGTVTVAQTTADQWHSVAFSAEITDAVVVMGPVTNADGDPVTTRIRNITDNGFEFQIDEWDYLDGVHGLESIGWLAVSEGTHTLASGQTFVAGTASVGTGFSSLAFGETLRDAVVLTEVSSVNEADAVAARIRSVTDTGFQVQIEEQEASGTHANETVSWIAIESGASASIEVVRTADQVSHTADSFTFATQFVQPPVLLADMQSTDGGDTSTVRMDALDETGVSLFIEEEQSADTELRHTNETVGFVALSGGLLTTASTEMNDAPLAVDDTAVTSESAEIIIDVIDNDSDLDGDALFVSQIDGQAVNVGDTANLASGAQVVLNPDGSLTFVPGDVYESLNDGETAQEVVTYQTSDGQGGNDTGTLTITVNGETDASPIAGQAGTVSVTQSSSNEWFSVTFDQAIADAVVVLGPVAFDDDTPATTRVRNVTDTGFEFQIDEWNYLDGIHATEDVGWMAVSAGEHTLASGQTIVAGVATVGTGFEAVDFGTNLTGAVVLSEVTSILEADAVTTRINNVSSTGFDVRLQEEEALGAHIDEQVSWIAIEAGGAAGIEAVRTPRNLDEIADTFAFTSDFADAPVILADIQSYYGADTSTLRYSDLSTAGMTLRLHEERSRDTELGHTNEIAGYLAIEDGFIF